MLANHLWQSTLFAGCAVMAATVLRNYRATLRYWIWVAASWKFLVPFAFLTAIGGRIPVPARTASAIPSALPPGLIEEVGRPFSIPLAAPAVSSLAYPLAAVWALGCLTLLVWRARQMQSARRSRQTEPAVVGIFRPALRLPEGIGGRLEPAQLRAILAHERCHIRRRDNLLAAIHMAVEAIFWFHPLVWWIGARLVEERENACDEEVLRLGNDPQAYAAGILNVCKFYLESRLSCVAGVSGGDLRKRITRIMRNRVARPLTGVRRILLAACAAAAIAGPIVIGLGNAPARAQALLSGEAMSFEVASVKPAAPDQRGITFVPAAGKLRIRNVPLKMLLAEAYEGQSFQIAGAPGWIATARYDIDAKAADPNAKRRDLRLMLQSLLAERFRLAAHRETREMPVYLLVPARDGAKLDPPKDPSGPHAVDFRNGGTQFLGRNAGMPEFAEALSFRLERAVLDRTGLKGGFDFKLEFSPDESVRRFGDDGPTEVNPEGISIFTAIQQQLGLKLEAGKGPVEVLVVDRIERPTGN